MAKRFFVDTLVAAQLRHRLIPVLRDLFGSGYVAIVSDAVIDIKEFQDAIGWTETQIEEGNMIIEAYYGCLDYLTEKPFRWSSRNVTTPEAISLYEATKNLENVKRIEALADLFDRSCIEREDWIKGRPNFKDIVKLSKEAQDVLGLPEDATRTQVLNHALLAKRMDLFNEFNAMYIKGMALQHDCTYVLTEVDVFELPTALKYIGIVTDNDGNMY